LKIRINVPTVVPVKAAPFAGEAPVPYLIWTLAPRLFVALSPSPDKIIIIFPVLVGVKLTVLPRPIITPAVDVVVFGFAGKKYPVVLTTDPVGPWNP
jgi:hypothetical protein